MWEILSQILSQNYYLNQITKSFYKTNNKNVITKNQDNGNCELLKDNSFMRSKNKDFFNSHINSSNNMAAFNCFGTLCNNEINNDVTEKNKQNDVVVTAPNNTTTVGILKKVSFQSNRKIDLL